VISFCPVLAWWVIRAADEIELRTGIEMKGAAAAAFIQAITAGLLCLGASALLAQIAFAIAAAAAALLLVPIFSWKQSIHGWALAAFRALRGRSNSYAKPRPNGAGRSRCAPAGGIQVTSGTLASLSTRNTKLDLLWRMPGIL
jgi:hypothetical protein